MRHLPFHAFFNSLKRIFFICMVIVWGESFVVFAQDSRMEKGEIKGIVVDSLNGQPLPRANISFTTSSGDTVHTAADKNGRFSIKYTIRCPSGNFSRIVIQVSHIGYSPWIRKIVPTSSRYDITVRMAQESVSIDEIAVKGRAVLITTKGDTIVYNASALNSMEHETAGDLMKKLPGITIEEHGNKKSLSYNGERIEVVFVNGRLVFGSDVTDAMDYVQAKDVNKIQVFEQKDKTKKKRRQVMNILTFSRLVGTIAGEVLLSGGSDTEKDMDGNHQLRYGAGGSYNIFATKNILKLKALTSNIDRHTTQIAQMAKLGEGRYSGYRKNVEAEAVYENSPKADNMTFVAGGGNHLHIDYGFNRQSQEDQQFSDYIYFPSDAWNSRTSNDTMQSWTRNVSHSLNARAIKYLDKKQATVINIVSNNSLRNNRDVYTHHINSTLDGKTLYATGLSNNNKNLAWNTNGSVSLVSILGKESKYRILVDFKYSLSDNDVDKLQLDTLEWSTSHTFINSSGGERNSTISGGVAFGINLGSKHDLSLSYSIDNTNTRYDKTAFDNLTGELDYSLTSRYTNHSLTHKSGVGYKYISQNGFSAEINIAAHDYRMDKSEFIPAERQYAKTYFDPVINCRFSLLHAMKTNLSFVYNNSPIYPSIEMVRPRIDNSDPLFLRSGNPDLKRAMLHTLSFRLNHTIPSSSSSVEIAAVAKLTTDAISTRTRFFTEEERLVEHDNYLAPAGSSLLTFVNVGKSYTADLSATYRFLCRPINSIISLTPAFSFENTPGYSDEVLNALRLYHLRFKAGIVANFSKKIKAELTSEMFYNDMRNSMKDDVRGITNQTDFNINYHFFKQCYATLNYRYYLYKGITYKDRNTYNQLNAGIGYRIFKSKMGEINLSVYDLLNSTRTYKVKTTAEYRQNIVSYYTGRYLLFTFSYRFNKKQA